MGSNTEKSSAGPPRPRDTDPVAFPSFAKIWVDVMGLGNDRGVSSRDRIEEEIGEVGTNLRI